MTTHFRSKLLTAGSTAEDHPQGSGRVGKKKTQMATVTASRCSRTLEPKGQSETSHHGSSQARKPQSSHHGSSKHFFVRDVRTCALAWTTRNISNLPGQTSRGVPNGLNGPWKQTQTVQPQATTARLHPWDATVGTPALRVPLNNKHTHLLRRCLNGEVG